MNENTVLFVFLGIALIWGVIFGRLFCGKICPVGYLQDLVYKIPFPKKIKTFKADKYLRLLKFAYLGFQMVFLVLSLLGLTTEAPRETVTMPSVVTPIAVVIFLCIMVFLQRPFCKYMCPVGAVSAFGNKISFFKYHFKSEQCIGCGKCIAVCKMDIKPFPKQNSPECIRCGKCKKICPRNAITFKVGK
jgi:polyferredoxin